MSRLVSICCCTRDRVGLLARAIDDARRQLDTYDNLQLVVVDGGEESVRDVVREHAGGLTLAYQHAPGLPLGDARNLACSIADGQIMVLWDDDDAHAPDRVEHQVRELERSRSRLVGLSRRLYYDAERGEVWERDLAQAQPLLDGGTLAFWRELWERRQFTPGVFQCEQDFVRAHRVVMRDLHGYEPAPYVVARLHAGNREGKDFDSPTWRRLGLDAVPDYAK